MENKNYRINLLKHIRITLLKNELNCVQREMLARWLLFIINNDYILKEDVKEFNIECYENKLFM